MFRNFKIAMIIYNYFPVIFIEYNLLEVFVY